MLISFDTALQKSEGASAPRLPVLTLLSSEEHVDINPL